MSKKADKKIELQLRHSFSEKEVLVLARKLAEGNNDLAQAEDEKKSVTSQLKAKADRIAAQVAETAGKITCGYEYRTTQVLVEYHKPKGGQKRLTRLDTNEIIGEEDMTEAEKQSELPLGTEKVTASPGTVAVPADDGSHDDQS